VLCVIILSHFVPFPTYLLLVNELGGYMTENDLEQSISWSTTLISHDF